MDKAQKAYDQLKDHPDKTISDAAKQAFEKTREAQSACSGIE